MQYHNFSAEEEQFPLYLNFKLQSINYEKLKAHFNSSSSQFINSMIFNTSTKSNEHNKDIRVSKKLSVKNKESFDIVNETVIPELNKLFKKHRVTMQLVEDELELVKYEKGGYFKKHRDFVNYISDQMKCYALLICLQAPEDGGETKLYFTEQDTKLINETKTEGGCLVFRNELVHEGCQIVSGTKIILKANIWCFKSYDIPANLDTLLLIRFENDKRCYILHHDMYKQYEQSLFVLHQQFEKSNEITLNDVTYEQFTPVYNLLKGDKNINYLECKDLLEYLGITNTNIKVLETMSSQLLQKYEQKMKELHEFIEGTKRMFLIKSFDDYLVYKKLFESEDHIVPIQFMLTFNDKDAASIQHISIYDCIPILMGSSKEIWVSDNLIGTNAELRIGALRLLILH